ncbi:Fanconi anemia group D2 protein, partial [Podila verticillata]
NDRLAYVIGQQIGKAATPLALIDEYVTGVLPSFLGDDDGIAQLHPMLSQSTFTTYTKVLYIQLAALVGEFTEDDFQDTETALQHVMKLTQCFQDLAGYVKSNDKKDVLGVTLRHSKTFMEQFIKRVIPFLGVHFKGHQDAVAKIFRHHLQPATRSLQNVCGHAKASKEQSLMSMVPSIKKTMELLIFQVKLMLETNDARVAFWVGNLKHRNLAGEEISSQLPIESEDEPEPEIQASDEDDDMPEDCNGKGKKVNRKKKTARVPTPSTTNKRKKSGASSSTKSAAAGKKRKSSKMVQEEDDERIHTKSQISNSDMSEDEQDQLEGEEQEMEDVYDDHAIEEQEERAERRRRVRNPYIDDAAMSGDDEEEEDDEENDEEEDEEEEEEVGDDEEDEVMEDEDE